MRLRRVGDGPIIDRSTHPSIGTNIQGPSLIRRPSWVDGDLGRYFLYFADHKGDHIRFAHADELAGPWTVVPGGVLSLADSGFPTEPPDHTAELLEQLHELYRAEFGSYDPPGGLLADAVMPHIASPDVVVDAGRRMVRMWFHGLDSFGLQTSRLATSDDGRSFTASEETLPNVYVRSFEHGGVEHLFAMPGRILRHRGPGPLDFEPGPDVFPKEARHAAVRVRGDRLEVVWTRVGDAPERLLLSTVDLTGDWTGWSASEPVELLRPERSWEGADEPLEPSRRSSVDRPVNQLRDPAWFIDDDDTSWVVYAIAGESGLALAEVVD